MPRTSAKKGIIPPNPPKGKRAKPVNQKLTKLLGKNLPITIKEEESDERYGSDDIREDDELDIKNTIFIEPSELKIKAEENPPASKALEDLIKTHVDEINKKIDSIAELSDKEIKAIKKALESKPVEANEHIKQIEKVAVKNAEIALAKKLRSGNLRL